MLGINAAIRCDNQPIGGEHSAATLFGETRLLTSWITPDAIDVQDKYNQLTSGLNSIEDKILACLRFVANFPYKRFVRVDTRVGNKTFTQRDAWLEPSQAMYSPYLNCANRTYLLASLLRQELPSENIWACLGNLNTNGQDGHAWTYVKLDRDYILETTNPKVRDKLIPIETVGNIYEDIVYVNDVGVRAIPERKIREPFSACYNCLPFLSDYLDRQLCL